MKVAITGHTAGIGQAFAHRFSSMGHEIIGISKRHGHNIRNITKIADMIAPCDIWINNAQAGYAQTELLYKVWERWQNLSPKMIWLISTMLTTEHRVIDIPGMSMISVAEYKNQKRALEDAFYQLKSQPGSPRMVMVRPGSVATQPGQVPDTHGADVNRWVNTVVDTYVTCANNNLWLEEISVGFTTNPCHL